MTGEGKNWRQVARTLDKTAVQAFDAPLSELTSLFHEAEKRCLSMTNSPKEQAEIKRRVIEWKFKILCDRNAPFDQVRKCYQAIRAVGFSNLETEANIETYFSDFCVRVNRKDEARGTLTRLATKLEGASKDSDLEVYRHFLEVCRERLAGL